MRESLSLDQSWATKCMCVIYRCVVFVNARCVSFPSHTYFVCCTSLTCHAFDNCVSISASLTAIAAHCNNNTNKTSQNESMKLHTKSAILLIILMWIWYIVVKSFDMMTVLNWGMQSCQFKFRAFVVVCSGWCILYAKN